MPNTHPVNPSPCIEPLEDRLLMAAASAVRAAYLDNRGQAFFLFTVGLDKSTLSRKTASLYKAGTDGQFGTADDVRLYTKVGYTRGRLSLRSDALAVNEPYRVRLNAAVIKDASGKFLDGEFRAAGNSGNGRGGGNYDVVGNFGSKTFARITTVAGYMNLRLYPNHAPITVNNFKHYANEAAWDNHIFHRSVADFVIQAGGKTVNGSNQIVDVHDHGNITNEPALSNVRGTIAMARAVDGNPATTNDQNSANNQWYLNVKDNTSLNTNDGGFTVFGELLNDGSLEVMDTINKFPTGNAGGDLSEIPVRDLSLPQQDPNGLNPNRDAIFINRIAMLYDVTATPNVQAGAVPAAARSLELAVAPALSPAVAKAFAAAKPDKQDSLFDDDAE